MTPFFITLHLDPNGGSVSEESVDIKAGGSYGLLPSAHRDGYIFAGHWARRISSSGFPASAK